VKDLTDELGLAKQDLIQAQDDVQQAGQYGQMLIVMRQQQEYVGERERDRERGRERERQTDRERDRESERRGEETGGGDTERQRVS
jgi:hypothetical protein